MARTVDTTLDLPTQTSRARQEIADADGLGSGFESVWAAINTLCEHYRGSIICDGDSNGVWTANSQAPQYRFPLQGESSSDEAADVWVYGRITSAGSATVRVITSGGGSTITQAITSTTLAWVSIGQVNVAISASDYEAIGFDISASTATIEVQAIAVFYARDRTALPAVAASAGSYPDGIIPHELSAAAGERVLTATRVRDAHSNLVALYKRPWPIVQGSFEPTLPSSAAIPWRSDVPPQLKSSTITARFYARVNYTGNGTGLQTGTITLLGPEGSTSISTTSVLADWLAVMDLSVTAPKEGTVRPDFRPFAVHVNQYLQLRSLSGWWAGLGY